MATKKAAMGAAKTARKQPAKKKAAKAKPATETVAPVEADSAKPLNVKPPGKQPNSSGMIRAARELLERDGPFIPYADGYWAKPKAPRDREGHPISHIKAFVLEILVRKGAAEFTKFKPVKGGKRAAEVRAVPGGRV